MHSSSCVYICDMCVDVVGGYDKNSSSGSSSSSSSDVDDAYSATRERRLFVSDDRILDEMDRWLTLC